jgi:hypothetical protein
MARKRESRLELATKYQTWADEAHRWQQTTPGLRDDYLKLAMGWHQLAAEVENSQANAPGR